MNLVPLLKQDNVDKINDLAFLDTRKSAYQKEKEIQ